MMAGGAEAWSPGRRQRRGGISSWDASGIFGEVVVAEESAGLPSARTLLLLYAADLAFRLRWEIKPALAEGLIVVAVPYVDTAIAFGRAAGLERRVARRHVQLRAEAGTLRAGDGRRCRRACPSDKDSWSLAASRSPAMHGGHPRRLLIRRTGAHLRMLGTKRKTRHTT